MGTRFLTPFWKFNVDITREKNLQRKPIVETTKQIRSRKKINNHCVPLFLLANEKRANKLQPECIIMMESNGIAHVGHVHKTKQFNAAIKIDGILFSAVSKFIFHIIITLYNQKVYLYVFINIDSPPSRTICLAFYFPANKLNKMLSKCT